MDILGAIEKEREYLSFRAEGKEPYHWAYEVKDYGFRSIAEFQIAKKAYLSGLDFQKAVYDEREKQAGRRFN